jgi:hypothetical protein
MGDVIDLTGDGGVLKTILRAAKPGAMQPTEDLPNVDGTSLIILGYIFYAAFHCGWLDLNLVETMFMFIGF